MNFFYKQELAKSVDSHRFTFKPGPTIGIDETVKNQDNKYNKDNASAKKN